jgi:hypothetical protein
VRERTEKASRTRLWPRETQALLSWRDFFDFGSEALIRADFAECDARKESISDARVEALQLKLVLQNTNFVSQSEIFGIQFSMRRIGFSAKCLKALCQVSVEQVEGSEL